LDKFREILQIENLYPDFRDLQKNILKPVAKELKEFADLSYECSSTDFKVMEGRKCVGLNFKIYNINRTTIFRSELWKRLTNILMGDKYKLNKFDMKELEYIYLEKEHDLELVERKIMEVSKKIFTGEIKINSTLPGYIMTVIKNTFPAITRPEQ